MFNSITEGKWIISKAKSNINSDLKRDSRSIIIFSKDGKIIAKSTNEEIGTWCFLLNSPSDSGAKLEVIRGIDLHIYSEVLNELPVPRYQYTILLFRNRIVTMRNLKEINGAFYFHRFIRID